MCVLYKWFTFKTTTSNLTYSVFYFFKQSKWQDHNPEIHNLVRLSNRPGLQ